MTAKAKMKASICSDALGQKFRTKQAEEMQKLVSFEQMVSSLNDKPEQVSANRSMIKRAIDDASSLKLDAEIYCSLLTVEAEKSTKASQDAADLAAQVNSLVESFLAERGYL